MNRVRSRATQSGIKINKNAMANDTSTELVSGDDGFRPMFELKAVDPHCHQKPSRLAFIQDRPTMSALWQSLLVKSRKNDICISVRSDEVRNVRVKNLPSAPSVSLVLSSRSRQHSLPGRFVETQLLPGKLTHGDFTRRCKAVLLRLAFT